MYVYIFLLIYVYSFLLTYKKRNICNVYKKRYVYTYIFYIYTFFLYIRREIYVYKRRTYICSHICICMYTLSIYMYIPFLYIRRRKYIRRNICMYIHIYTFHISILYISYIEWNISPNVMQVFYHNLYIFYAQNMIISLKYLHYIWRNKWLLLKNHIYL